jgi:1-acyl-sn-glycerol-3-phosphate acyltransferase
MATERSALTEFQPPTGKRWATLEMMLQPWLALTRPLCFGLDNVPTDRPALFVGNHTLFGVLDVPLMLYELYHRRGVFLRSLADHVHFKIPLWGNFLTWGGAVDGTRDNCAALMRARQSILVFPGGAREVFKRRGEKYTLLWKERIGFCRLAIRHGYSIVPFGTIGVEEFWDVVFDSDDFFATPVGKLYRRLGFRADTVAPLAFGLGPTPLPKVERVYFGFGRPIPTSEYAGQHDDTTACIDLQKRVKWAVERQVAKLMRERDQDPERYRVAD